MYSIWVQHFHNTYMMRPGRDPRTQLIGVNTIPIVFGRHLISYHLAGGPDILMIPGG
jgi:hypothetical protein